MTLDDELLPGEPDTEAENAAIGRLEGLTEREAWEGDITVMATCGVVAGRPSTTTGGMRGSVRFEMPMDTAESMMQAIGQRAFDLTFSKAHLGDGYTIGRVSGRPDADGAARAFVDFQATENAAPKLGTLFTRGLIGSAGKLVLGTSQISMSELLTKKAED
jgi:hypothetical protein